MYRYRRYRLIFRVSVSPDLLPILPWPEIDFSGRILLVACYFVQKKWTIYSDEELIIGVITLSSLLFGVHGDQ